MKRIYLILELFLFVALPSMAQNIQFRDKGFEAGVKEQLGLDSTDYVLQEMAEYIRTLNLEGYGIQNIRDIVYFPMLEELNLANNAIRDISPLLILGKLRYLNIKNNLVDAVDLLALTESPQMTVNLSLNYITNFYAVLHSPQCLFSIIGMNLQYPYKYNVHHFYTDYNLSDMRGIVNSNFWLLHTYDSCFVENGEQKVALLPDSVQQTAMNAGTNKIVLLLDTAAMDYTCFVKPEIIEITSDTLVLVPVFPEKYTLLSVKAFHSEVYRNNDSILFICPDDVARDTLKVGFGSEFGKLKGYTYYFPYKKCQGITVTNYSATICQGSVYTDKNFKDLTLAGIYRDTLQNVNGCDSIVELTLTVNPLPSKPVISRNENVLISSSPTDNQWYLNDTPISGATQQTYTCTQNGIYSVEVTNAHGCTIKSDTVILTTMGGIVAGITHALRIYPNPTTGELRIENGELRIENVEIFDIYGRKQSHVSRVTCHETGEARINISHLSAGIYFLRIHTEAGEVVRKVVKE